MRVMIMNVSISMVIVTYLSNASKPRQSITIEPKKRWANRITVQASGLPIQGQHGGAPCERMLEGMLARLTPNPAEANPMRKQQLADLDRKDFRHVQQAISRFPAHQDIKCPGHLEIQNAGSCSALPWSPFSSRNREFFMKIKIGIRMKVHMKTRN